MPNVGRLAPRRLGTVVVRFALLPLRAVARKRPLRAVEHIFSHPASLVSPATNATTASKPTGIIPNAHLPSFNTSSTMKTAAKITKEALLLTLEGLAQSADAFPPLKSAVGGLLFIVSQAELVSSNKAQIHGIYIQIDGFAASLERAVPDIMMLSPAARAAICALAEGVQAVRKDMEGIACQKRGIRILRAKRHSMQVQDLAARLNQADASFTRTMLASGDLQGTRILACTELVREDLHSLSHKARSFFLHRLSTLRPAIPDVSCHCV